LRAVLPPKWAYQVSRLEPFGMFIVLGMVAFGLTRIIFMPAFMVMQFLLQALGLPFRV
jgi:hypothetical protein